MKVYTDKSLADCLKVAFDTFPFLSKKDIPLLDYIRDIYRVTSLDYFDPFTELIETIANSSSYITEICEKEIENGF